MEEDIKRLEDILSEAKEILGRVEDRVKYYKLASENNLEADMMLNSFLNRLYEKYPENKSIITRWGIAFATYECVTLGDFLRFTSRNFRPESNLGAKSILFMKKALKEEFNYDWA